MNSNLCNPVQRDNPTCNLNKVIINFAQNKDFVDKFGRYFLKWHVRLSGRVLLVAKKYVSHNSILISKH